MTRRLALMLALLAPATAVAKPQRMSKAAFKPATRPPSYVQLRKLAKLAATPQVQTYSRIKALGGTRFAALVGMRSKAASVQMPKLYLVVVEKRAGSWHVERALLADYAPIARAFDSKANCAKVLVSLYVSDYDWDGKPEVKVRHRLKRCDEDGSPIKWAPTQLDIYNTSPLRPALRTKMKIGKGNAQYKDYTSKVTHRDVNKDGHPDLLIRTQRDEDSPNIDKSEHEVSLRTYHYLPSADRYKLISDKVLVYKEGSFSKPQR